MCKEKKINFIFSKSRDRQGSPHCHLTQLKFKTKLKMTLDPFTIKASTSVGLTGKA